MYIKYMLYVYICDTHVLINTKMLLFSAISVVVVVVVVVEVVVVGVVFAVDVLVQDNDDDGL